MTEKLTNADILNAVRDSQSAEYQNNIPVATGLNDSDILRSLEAYPTSKNAFITTLTDRIGRQMFFDKVFNNPYKMLHRGELPYGKSIEQLFTEMAEEKGFDDHFTGSNTPEGDLIKVNAPKVHPDYIKQNFQYKFKTSISDLQLRGAFTSRYGLMDLITSAVNSLLSSTEFAEYRDMKKILLNKTADSTNGSTIGKGLVQKMFDDTAGLKTTAFKHLGNSWTVNDLAVEIRATANQLTFPSTKYNLAKVRTFSKKQDLVLFVDPTTQAKLDVNLLAMAFNVSSADVNVRTILVDDLGQIGEKNVVAVLADKDIIQAYDTINTTNTFYNPERLSTNYFAHKHGIMAGCSFAQAVVFVEGEGFAG